MPDPKHILILITDQQTAGAMSCAGNEWLHTPAMDRLASEGTRFTRAYCTYPLCTPSRASQMTGRYPHEVNANRNEGRFFWYHDIAREQFMGYPFAQAGYRCVWAGKDMPPEDGSRDFELLCPWGDEQTADTLATFLQGEHDRPFLAVGNFVNPHNICEFARHCPLLEGDLGPEPPLREMPPLPANHAVPPFEPEIIRVIQQLGHNVYAARRFSPEQWRWYIWGYYRMVEKVDALVGRVLAALDEAGLRDNTLVVFCSDHGDGCGAHQWNQKQVLYEEVIRVPFIVRGPQVSAGVVDGRLVSSCLDLFPTCAAYAGIEPPANLEGLSLWPALRGESSPWRDAVFVETALNPETGDVNPLRNRGRAVVTDRYKYAVWSWGHHREHLVDLRSDPGEMVNLVQSTRHDTTLVEMRGRLQRWVEATDDVFAVPGYETLSPNAGWNEMERIRSRSQRRG